MKYFTFFLPLLATFFSAPVAASQAERTLQGCISGFMGTDGHQDNDERVAAALVSCDEARVRYMDHLLVLLGDAAVWPFAHARALVHVHSHRVALLAANEALVRGQPSQLARKIKDWLDIP